MAITAEVGGVGGEEEAVFVAVDGGFLGVGMRGAEFGGAGDEDDESV